MGEDGCDILPSEAGIIHIGLLALGHLPQNAPEQGVFYIIYMYFYELLKRPVAFHPALARLFGGVNEALLWQQIYYWSDKGGREDGWIYKTKEELEIETTLTRKQQDLARKKLETLGVLETKLMKANGAPTLHYRIDAGLVLKLLSDSPQRDYSISTKGTNPLYTESTTNTSEQSSRISEDVDDDDTTLVACDDWGEELSAKKKKDTSYRKVFVAMGGPNYPLAWNTNRTEIQAAKNLLAERGLQKVKEAVKWWRQHKDEQFCPDLSTPYSLDNKWDKALNFKYRD